MFIMGEGGNHYKINSNIFMSKFANLDTIFTHKNRKVIVYSTDSCPYCVFAKDFFKSKGISFEDKNVGVDRVAAQEMVMKSGQMGVPVIDIDGQIIVGFRPDVFEKLING